MQIYLVGGIIRDKLLGVQSNDYDYSYVSDCETIDQAWEEMKLYLAAKQFSIFLETRECLTIRARFPNSKVVGDFVIARKEYYPDQTRKPVVSVGTLYDDLERRDFTINAMAETLEGELIDPFNGQLDLKNRLLRCPLDPVVTFFDDPLRILRAFRFAVTKQLQIDESIINALGVEKIWEKFDKAVSSDRIRVELHKMFKHDTVESIKMLNLVGKYYPVESILRDMWL